MITIAHLPLCRQIVIIIALMLNASLLAGAHAHCEQDQFTCKDGSCILLEKMCDGRPQCPDYSDESDCDARMCREPNWFQCAQPHGPCLTIDLKCNGIENCPGGEDERNCSSGMRSTVSPSNRKKKKCTESEYTCQTDKTCIPLDFMCDGKRDCNDNSDETAGCLKASATCKGFFCANNHCLERASWRCDGIDDCGDGSDERNCTDRNCTPEYDKFLCHDNSTCLELTKACDGRADCKDGSDESAHCSAPTNDCSKRKCPAAAKCVMLPTFGAECVCPRGFRYSQLQNACLDIDECTEMYGVCSQKCENTSGGYRCRCDEAYALLADNRTCEAQGEEPLLLYTTQLAVMGVHLRSNRVFIVTKNLTKVIGVAYDGQHIYWTNIQSEAESIVRSNVDGTNQEILLTSGLDAPEDLAVDWYTGNIYFSDNLQHHIAVCSNDGHYCDVLATIDVHQPRGITLWPQKGQMFWTDWGVKPMIARASMDGSHMLAIVTENIHWPNGITLDMHNNRVYWVDAKLMSIESVRPDGTDRRIVLDGILKHPYGLAIFEDRIYWSDWHTKSLHSCHKFTGKDHRVVTKDRKMYAVHIYHSAKQPKPDHHPCQNTRCSHLCLLAEDSFSCACPDGMHLGTDRLRCVKSFKRPRLFIGVHNELLEMEHTNFGRHLIAESHHLNLHISEMTYNSVNGTVIVADNMQHVIYEYSPTDKHLQPLVQRNLGNITGIAFDHVSHNIYWTDSERHAVEVYSMQTRERAVISFFAGYEVPISIVLVPEDGIMFVALRQRNHMHIDQISLTGIGERVHVVEEDLGNKDIKFAIDYDMRTIFWSDNDHGRISFSHYRNMHPYIFRNRLNRPYSLAVVDEDLFWSSLHSSVIHWSHKSNLGPLKVVQIEAVPDGFMQHKPLPAKIPLLAGMMTKPIDHKCQHNNGGCSHVCVTQSLDKATCLCPAGFVFRDTTNSSCIEKLDCEFRCRSGECLTQSRRCNGRKDCPDASDEENCSPDDIKHEKVICPLGKFMCHNAEQCVLSTKRCNGNNDCRDGSDEEHCDHFDKEKRCHNHQHACENGHCVDLSAMCDGFDDCGDHSDEANCKTSTCDQSMFRCNSGTCIARSWECDGKLDCADSSDEHDKCSLKDCPTEMHKCGLGQCIDKKLVCDGHNDCGDSSDELNCYDDLNIRRRLTCGNETHAMYACISDPKICLQLEAKCNGTAECPRGEDEADCGSICSIYEFKCHTGEQCVRLEFHCDHDKDCDDGSDEQNCDYHVKTNSSLMDGTPPHERACEPHMFDCKDNMGCVEMTRVCDDFSDCDNGADEGPQCKAVCRKSSDGRSVCEHKCRPTPTGAVCSCFAGYRLDVDQRHCVDINECQEQDPCSQLCENTHGSYRCSCYPDFMLRPDKTTCKSIESESSLLFSTYDEVRAMSREPITLRVLWSTNDSKIDGFDVDVRRRLAYFTSENEDMLYQLNMTSRAVIGALTLWAPSKVAIDWTTGNVYVISRSKKYSIHVCSFSAQMCGQIIEANPREVIRTLAVDGYNRRLFYVTTRTQSFTQPMSQISIAHMDGHKRELLLGREGSHINAIAIDPHKRQLYFLDMHTRTLQAISYKVGASRNPITLVHKGNIITYPSGLCIYENQAFIVNTGAKEVVRCQLFGLRQCEAYNLNILNAGDVLIDGASRQPITTNPCAMAKCNGMCVQSDYAYQCMCAGTFVSEHALCAKTATNAIVQSALLYRNNNQIADTSSGETSHGFLITLCILVVIAALVGAGYFYYRRIQQGHRDFNINLHFQNPLASLVSGNKTATLRSNGSATTSASFEVEQEKTHFTAPMYRYMRRPPTNMQSSGTEIQLETTGKRSAVHTLEPDGQMPNFLMDDEDGNGSESNHRSPTNADDMRTRLLP